MPAPDSIASEVPPELISGVAVQIGSLRKHVHAPELQGLMIRCRENTASEYDGVGALEVERLHDSAGEAMSGVVHRRLINFLDVERRAFDQALRRGELLPRQRKQHGKDVPLSLRFSGASFHHADNFRLERVVESSLAATNKGRKGIFMETNRKRPLLVSSAEPNALLSRVAATLGRNTAAK